MLSFSILQAVAQAVYEHYRALRSEVRRLENEPCVPVDTSVESAAGLPSLVGQLEYNIKCSQELARRLPIVTPEYPKAVAADGLHVVWRGRTKPQEDMRWHAETVPDYQRLDDDYGRRHHLGWNTAEGSISKIVWEYDPQAEIRDATGSPLVVFEFSNRSLWDHHYEPAETRQERAARRRALQEVRRQIRAFEALHGTSWTPAHQAHLAPLLDRENKLQFGGQFQRLRNSWKAKLERWAYRVGNWQLLAKLYWPKADSAQRAELIRLRGWDEDKEPPRLGSIVLSAKTNAAEIALKMALLAARCDLLEDGSRAAVIAALAAFLCVDELTACEVFGQAALSDKRGLGYVGDFSHVGFRIYLRKVRRSLKPKQLIEALPSENLKAIRGKDRVWRQGRRTRNLDPVGKHPWNRGQPALLSRLAADFEIRPSTARQWARDGRLAANDCAPRVEHTPSGGEITGTIEVPASERARWESLCAGNFDRRARSAKTRGQTPTEKKSLYRQAKRSGASRDKAADLVRGLAQRAGLL